MHICIKWIWLVLSVQEGCIFNPISFLMCFLYCHIVCLILNWRVILFGFSAAEKGAIVSIFCSGISFFLLSRCHPHFARMPISLCISPHLYAVHVSHVGVRSCCFHLRPWPNWIFANGPLYSRPPQMFFFCLNELNGHF